MPSLPNRQEALAAGVNGAANRGEGRVGIAAQRGNGADAYHNNQSKHHGVLDGCRAVFTLEEIDGKFYEFTHGSVLSVAWRSACGRAVRTHGFASPSVDGLAVSRMHKLPTDLLPYAR